MDDKSFVKLGGLFNIVMALLFIGTSVFLGDRILYAWLGLAGSVLLVPATWGLYQFIEAKNNRVAIQLGVMATFVGVIFLVGIYLLAYIGEVSQPYFDAGGESALELLEEILHVSNLVTILIGSFLTYGVGPALIALASLKTFVVPKWAAWLGIFGGVWGLLWGGWVWLIPPERILIFLPSVVAVLLWSIIMGVYMLRYRQPQ